MAWVVAWVTWVVAWVAWVVAWVTWVVASSKGTIILKISPSKNSGSWPE